MKGKKILYTSLLVLFGLLLLVSVALWLLPEPVEADAPSTPEAADEASFDPASIRERDGFSQGMTRPQGEGQRPGEGSPAWTDQGEEPPQRPSRRRDRSGQGEEAEGEMWAEIESAAEAAALDTSEGEMTLIDRLTALAYALRPWRVYLTVGSLLGVLLCALRLILLVKKTKASLTVEETEPVSHRKQPLWPAALLFLAALVLVVLLFPVEEEEAAEGAVANTRLVSGIVESKDITAYLQSTGALESQEALKVTLPASVTLSAATVRNGDSVQESQIIAQVDKTSVMKAIAAVHEALAEIDSQLEAARTSKTSASVTAPVAGTVKAVYAQAGERALDVMARDGALMLLSLDGRMAVDIPAEELTTGRSLTVVLSDGTTLPGEVAAIEDGIATVTILDRGYPMGAQASVLDETGSALGSGPLYVHRGLNITGYLGIITRVHRLEGSSVYAGTPLLALSETEDLAQYAALLRQREEYEQELTTLFSLYQTGFVLAPGDGIISGLSEELPYATLEEVAAGLTVRRLATSPRDADPGEYVHYLGQVTANDGGLLTVNMGVDPVSVSSFSALPGVPGSTMVWEGTIPGAALVYRFISGWSTVSPGDILPGDKILFTFDSQGAILWVIVESTTNSATPSPTPTPTPMPTPSPTPSTDDSPSPEESARPNPSTSPVTGGHGGGRTGGSFSFRIPSGGASSASKTPAYTIATQTLCAVTPQERMLVTVSIDELDVLSLSLGQEATVYLDALSMTSFVGRVTEIDPEGLNSGGNTKYSVTLSLDKTEQMYPGMNATVCFLRESRQGVPAIPLAALQESGGAVMVYTSYDPQTDQLLDPVAVVTGVSDGTEAELLSGLTSGDAYFYRYADSISYITD